jgi:triphosphoribosyl-dephospho-CoA synthase
LIFDLGVVVTAYGYKIGNLKDNLNLFSIIKSMTKGVTKELEEGRETFGKVAYQKYKIGGARLEAENGFPHVQKLLKNNYTNIQSLIYLISSVDDTVLLKRCGNYETYLKVKDEFKNLNLKKWRQLWLYMKQKTNLKMMIYSTRELL